MAMSSGISRFFSWYRSPARWLHLIADGLESRRPTNSVAVWGSRKMRFTAPSPFPGRFDPTRHPALLGIMDWLAPSNTATVVTIMGCVQSGKSTVIQLWLGQQIDERPGMFRVVVPDGDSIKSWQANKVEKLFEAVDVFAYLRERTHDREHALGSIEYVGGHLSIRAAGTAQTFAEAAIRNMVLDDTDRYPKTKEGDVVALAKARTATYHLSGGKVLVVSTPTTKDGVINQSWLAGSMRKYWVPCRHCGAFQPLEPHRMVWTPGDYRSVHMVCMYAECRGKVTQREMSAMLQLGEWRASKPEMVGDHESCHMWAALVPYEMYSWEHYARAFEVAETAEAAGNYEKMQTFTNHVLALPYEFASDKRLDEIGKLLLARVKRTPPFVVSELPIRVVTAGADVQKEWIETTVAGFGPGYETWVLNHHQHRGHYTDAENWSDWAEWIISLTPKVRAVCIDGGFQHTSTAAPGLSVSAQLRLLFPLFAEAGIAVWITRGMGGEGPLWPGPRPPMNLPDSNASLVSIRVDFGKDWIYQSIRAWADGLLTTGPNFIHIDNRRSRHFVASLMSERLARKEDHVGKTKYVRRAAKGATEVLDDLVLCRAAVDALAGAIENPVERAQFLALMNPAPTSPSPRPVRESRRARRDDREDQPSDWVP